MANRISDTSATLIDNIFTNFFDWDYNSSILYTDISDHLPIFSLTKTNNVINKYFVNYYHRVHTKNNKDNFRSKIANISWENVLHENDTELAYSNFMNLFGSLLNQCFPLKNNKKKDE